MLREICEIYKIALSSQSPNPPRSQRNLLKLSLIVSCLAFLLSHFFIWQSFRSCFCSSISLTMPRPLCNPYTNHSPPLGLQCRAVVGLANIAFICIYIFLLITSLCAHMFVWLFVRLSTYPIRVWEQIISIIAFLSVFTRRAWSNELAFILLRHEYMCVYKCGWT